MPSIGIGGYGSTIGSIWLDLRGNFSYASLSVIALQASPLQLRNPGRAIDGRVETVKRRLVDDLNERLSGTRVTSIPKGIKKSGNYGLYCIVIDTFLAIYHNEN